MLFPLYFFVKSPRISFLQTDLYLCTFNLKFRCIMASNALAGISAGYTVPEAITVKFQTLGFFAITCAFFLSGFLLEWIFGNIMSESFELIQVLLGQIFISKFLEFVGILIFAIIIWVILSPRLFVKSTCLRTRSLINLLVVEKIFSWDRIKRFRIMGVLFDKGADGISVDVWSINYFEAAGPIGAWRRKGEFCRGNQRSQIKVLLGCRWMFVLLESNFSGCFQ